MLTTSQVRSAFLSFFARNGHDIVPSSPLLPHNDPTLMFTNAGMVPFKNVFTGQEHRPYSRAASSQKCVRAGGKHNDLDNVGYTARHHTFFEMLGNFSFGDYFKEEAITLAWNLVTKEFSISPEKLCVTVYHTDDEAFDLWKKISGFPDHKIIRIPTNDNFWSMGDTGPCGPCSEIFYDHGAHIPGGPPGSAEADGDRFVEIWNLVFMQFDRDASGTLTPLPAPSIDTGMGLERISAVLQGRHDNYDTDLFAHLIAASKTLSKDIHNAHPASHRVIADHLRASSFLIADGILPSNEGRGYVLRRIMRRAMRHAHQLGVKEPLMHQLVPALIEVMGENYSELSRARALITETLRGEETRFRETLGRGIQLLSEESAGLKSGDKFSGDTAFKLYDTYGFPLDLTEDILRARGIMVDNVGFESAMAEQKKRARAAWSGSGEKATETVWFDVREQCGATEFLGYDQQHAQGIVTALIEKGGRVKSASAGAEVEILLNQTPFYGESGGQQGDHGILENAATRIRVIDTSKKLGTLIVHRGVIERGSIAEGDALHAHIDVVRRTKLRANHSATHLLHSVLREVLGEHVTQKGSLVAEDRLRFDFSHTKPMSAEEKREIETRVNHLIRQNTHVTTRLMAIDQAMESGAMALFGEKYDEEVRVISMGEKQDGSASYSVELCGGTHVRATGDIGVFVVLSEASVASGVRRIEATTGQAALEYLEGFRERIFTLAERFKTAPDLLEERIKNITEERKQLEKELSEARKKAAMGGDAHSGAAEKETVNGVEFMGKYLGEISPKDLRDMATSFKQKMGSGIVALAAQWEGKASVIVAVTEDRTATHSASVLIQAAAELLGGRGGGKPDFAQAGGAVEKIEQVIAVIREALREGK